MTPVFRLCDEYVTRWAALDPVAAGMQGLTGVFGAATDYGPDGFVARAELIAATLDALEPMSLTSDADRLAAGFLCERLRLSWPGIGAASRSGCCERRSAWSARSGTAWTCCRATVTTAGGTSRRAWPPSRSCSRAGEPAWTPGSARAWPPRAGRRCRPRWPPITAGKP